MVLKICLVFVLLACASGSAQTNKTDAAASAGRTNSAAAETQTNQTVAGQRVEELRADCLERRRTVCGRIVRVSPEGLVVESGYDSLTRPPLNRSWLVPATATVGAAPHLVEGNRQDCICVGLVFLSDYPSTPRPGPNDYVNLKGYPVGEFSYTSVGEVRRTIRRFSVKLKKAVQWRLDEDSRKGKP
jgi:hypothetical protein